MQCTHTHTHTLSLSLSLSLALSLSRSVATHLLLRLLNFVVELVDKIEEGKVLVLHLNEAINKLGCILERAIGKSVPKQQHT